MSVIDDDNESLADEIDAGPEPASPADGPDPIDLLAILVFLAICVALFCGLNTLAPPR